MSPRNACFHVFIFHLSAACSGLLTVTISLLNAVCFRWYSEEYDWFYLESSSTNYVLRVSLTGNGDAKDAINESYSPANGKPFANGNTLCTSTYGLWWFSDVNLCCFSRLFGSPGSVGFQWLPVANNLIVSRMMIKQTN